MPTPDIPSTPRRREGGGRPFPPGFADVALAVLRRGKRRKPGKDNQDGGVLVEPDRPRNLSGGAAEPLVFEDD